MGAGAIITVLLLFASESDRSLEEARDRQDRAALERIMAERAALAQKRAEQAEAHLRLAEAASYLAEVALEQRDREAAQRAAETGIRAAERAVALQPAMAESHRLLGTLCGQIIPSNIWLAVRYGKCASESIRRALELDPNSWRAWLSQGVGKYYLPPAFGGSPEAAIADFRRALELNPQAAEAWLWLGIALRKAGRLEEAREALRQSLELNPARAWARQQLEKTPAR